MEEKENDATTTENFSEEIASKEENASVAEANGAEEETALEAAVCSIENVSADTQNIFENTLAEEIPEELYKQCKKGLWWKVLLFVLGGIIVLSAIAGIVVWKVNDFFVHVTINEAPEITLEVGESFSDPGASAYFSGTHIFKQPLPLEMSVHGAVDSNVIGSYQIEYSSDYCIDLLVIKFLYHDSKIRTVHVVDSQMPVITLVSSEEKYTIPGQPYEEEGYQAVDNYDGDITDRVQRNEENGKVYYTVSDSSGNTVTAERLIKYFDPYPPELVLKGNDDISIVVGGSYSEPGYTATDNYDGDITDKVSVSGSVDTSKTGTYTLEYSVTDSYNNTTTVKRIVRIYSTQPDPGLVIPDLPMGDGAATVVPNGKVIYLTFDDGPSGHTSRLLDILDAYGVKATFFVVNTSYLYLLPRMAQSGHTIAVHCYSHKYDKVYASDEAYFNDLYKMQSIIQSYTGHAPTLVRFPGGSSNTVSRKYCRGIISRVAQKLDEMGYKYFDWNVDSGDAYKSKSKDAVIDRVIGGIKNKNYAVVLQHDIFGFSVDAVETIIKWGLANGYTFQSLDSSSPGCHQSIAN